MEQPDWGCAHGALCPAPGASPEPCSPVPPAWRLPPAPAHLSRLALPAGSSQQCFYPRWDLPLAVTAARGDSKKHFHAGDCGWLSSSKGRACSPGTLPASPSTAQPVLSLLSAQTSLPRSVGASNCSPASHSRNWFKLSCFKAPQGAPCHRSTKHSSCGVFLQRGAQPQGTNLVTTCRGPGAAATSAQSCAQPPPGPNLPTPCHGVGHGAARRLLVVLPEQAATQTTLARPRGG